MLTMTRAAGHGHNIDFGFVYKPACQTLQSYKFEQSLHCCNQLAVGLHAGQ